MFEINAHLRMLQRFQCNASIDVITGYVAVPLVTLGERVPCTAIAVPMIFADIKQC